MKYCFSDILGIKNRGAVSHCKGLTLNVSGVLSRPYSSFMHIEGDKSPPIFDIQ